MLDIVLTVSNAGKSISRDYHICVDENSQVSILIKLLIRQLGWPERDKNGREIVYEVRAPGATNTKFKGEDRISKLNLVNCREIELISLGSSMPDSPEVEKKQEPHKNPSPTFTLELPHKR